ncbi:MAG: PIG-L family deacetylase, partial [Deltaproteobacteria bacterium]|nr:PIG-L family deacetylase [Deltaproteobacteria bacterium]
MTDKELTLLAVHAHPDDECIGTGGILAKYSAQGIRTALVYGTRGEAGDILNPDFVPPAPGMSVKEIRALELKKSLKVLGVKSVDFLGYRDSGMAGTSENNNPQAFAQADILEAAGRLVEIIRRVRPHIVVTYNRRGVYGHPDHIMVNKVTLRAFHAASDPDFTIEKELSVWKPSKLYYTAIPLKRLRMMYDMAIERGEEPRLDPEVLGTPEEKITTIVDVREFISQKLEALNCHQSQISPNNFFRRIP